MLNHRFSHFLNIVLAFLFVSVFVACGDNEPNPVGNKTPRTILVYMVSNNSLGTAHSDEKDIAEMVVAARAGDFGNGRLLLFRAGKDGNQVLYEIKPDGTIETLKTYDAGSYAISSKRMLEVMNDAKTAAPADDYGLIMWSHAHGWTQNGQVENTPEVAPKTWGDDGGHTMNITTLAGVLGQSRWSFVYFDCCFMGSVEVAYELAPSLDKMVASASEIPLDGMPYDKNLKVLFAKTPDLEGAALNTFEYYENQPMEYDRTCTISVLDLRGMRALAEATRPIYEASKLVSVNDFDNLALALNSRPLFYDFGVYVHGMAEANNIDPALVQKWDKAYAEVVTFFRATPRLWNYISLRDFTGMSTYIPRTEADMTYRNYNTLSWYTDVASALYNKK